MNPQALRQRFAGQVHLPGEPGYDENRRSLNPAVDARPAVIVEAANTTDVRTALVTSRALDVPFSVQATGHGTHTANDGGILVRTGGLATALVDPDRRIARVPALFDEERSG
jgi:FAD/FMN-containing dehydrogenase